MTDNPSELTAKRRRISVAVVIGLTLLSGVVHGNLHGRWGRGDEFAGTGARLHELPERCGDWKLAKQLELPDYAAKMLRCYGSEVRVYRNEVTNVSVNATVLFGPRGPTAVHTPEVCFKSVGTKQVGTRQVETLRSGNERHQLWSAKFSRQPLPEPSVETWWAWRDGSSWQASDNPRYGWTENLYKIQVAGPVGDDTQQPCRDFLTAFLPHVEKVVSPTTP